MSTNSSFCVKTNTFIYFSPIVVVVSRQQQQCFCCNILNKKGRKPHSSKNRKKKNFKYLQTVSHRYLRHSLLVKQTSLFFIQRHFIMKNILGWLHKPHQTKTTILAMRRQYIKSLMRKLWSSLGSNTLFYIETRKSSRKHSKNAVFLYLQCTTQT